MRTRDDSPDTAGIGPRAARSRHIGMICAGAFFLSCSLATIGGTCEAAPVHVPTSTGDQLLYSRSYALIVAQKSYSAPWDTLDTVPGEVSRLESALLQSGFEAQDITIMPDVPSSRLFGVVQAFINAPGHRVDTARLLIFYAGHGYTTNLDEAYLVPVDAPAPSAADFYEKVVPLAAIKAVAGTATARHTLLVFDSCFSGGIFSTRSDRPLTGLEFEDLSRRGIQVITAGNADQRVPSKSEFVDALIVGADGAADLDKDGIVTAAELTIYLKRNVKLTSPQGGAIGYETGGEFSFIRDPKRVRIATSGESPPPRASPSDALRAQPTSTLRTTMPVYDYSTTCRYTAGAKAGRTEYFPPLSRVTPAIVGEVCQDAEGSSGIAIPDDPSMRVQVSSVCTFTAGPRAGQSQDYAPMPPVPLGTPCQDGVGSSGFVK